MIYTIQEAVNLFVSGGWTPGTALDISNAAHAYATLDKDTKAILVQNDDTVYFHFDISGSTDTIDAAKHLRLPACSNNEIHVLVVPGGLKDRNANQQITVHFKQVVSIASREVRYVEV